MNHTPKIFFTDLDGTLLNDKKEISKENWNCIQKWIRRGNKVVICTGRALSSAIRQAENLRLTMEGCYIISYNGAIIYDVYEKKILFQRTLAPEHAEYLIDLAHQMKIHIQAYRDEDFICEAKDFATIAYSHATGMSWQVVDNLKTALTWETPKLLLIDYQNKQPLLDFQNEIKEWAADKISYFFSSNALLELVPLNVNKGNAVKALCRHLNIPLSATISAGDAPNDIPMLKVTAESIVMKNADPSLIPYATLITEEDNNHSGVAKALQRYF